jgi:hypothetical protein
MTDDDGLIRAQVAQVLNSTDLAINRGAKDGVEVGMRFAILSDRGAEIKDPETGEVLGSIEIAKTLVKIISVTPRVAVGRTFRTKGGASSIASALAYMTASERSETLRTDERRVQQELDPKDSFIKAGDQAVQYTGESYAGIVYDF